VTGLIDPFRGGSACHRLILSAPLDTSAVTTRSRLDASPPGSPMTADDADLRCPSCRSLDWYRDGFALHEREDGLLVRRRLTASADRDTPWSCAACGYEVPGHTLLHRRLMAAQASELADRPV